MRRKQVPLRRPLTRLTVVEQYGSVLVRRWAPEGRVGYRTRPVWVQREYEGDKSG